MRTPLRILIPAAVLFGGTAAAQDSIDTLVERGQELYNAQFGCWVCHGETGEGLVGPTLLNGPTPAEILDQLESNPMMGVIVQEIDTSDDDLVALSLYIRQLAVLQLEPSLTAEYRTAPAAVRASRPETVELPKTERDLVIESIQSYGSVLTDWERRANRGSLERNLDVEVLANFDAGAAKFEPQPNHTYFYENIGTGANRGVLAPNGREMWATSNAEGRIYVFDTATREQSNVIDIPHHGDPHGLVWVHYDEDGEARVVRDQGGFHNGINPAAGHALSY
ncbi:MAG: hypothetical protein ACJ0SL_01260 [Candidatus Rariloculaceae bacterium]